MNGLLLVAHGSRREESNQEIRELTEDLRRKATARFPMVQCAFLELAEPSIPEGIRALVGKGAESVVVVPYFLSAGRHVASDIPEILDSVRQEIPNVDISVSAYLGAAPGVSDLILSLVEK